MGKLARFLKGLLIALAVIAVCLYAVLEFYPMMNDRALSYYAEDAASSWMKDLPDDRLLSDISIPGVHDAAANETQLRLLTKCQDKDLGALLKDGFRYLDIRLGAEEKNGQKDLTFYHGFLHCLGGAFPWSPHLTFEDAAKACGDFLTQNPTETVLFVVKQEHGSESAAEFENLLNDLIQRSETKDQWLLTDRIPTLKEARGKIVLFRRYKDEAGLKEKAGIYIDWEDQGNRAEEGSVPGIVSEEKDTFLLFIQDRYKYDAKDKWQVFADAVKEGSAKKQPEDVLINFLSTNGSASYGHPYKPAAVLNKQLLDEETGNALCGWTVVDFGDMLLAKRIYDMNR
ncbi:MAG: phosphatidylinositol-specific phospholipase C domain-containing protein [Lachnospiraceae bacterium]|nr:phosphatidylinositol-specific phospholipase C domain-containing protein [Lachnospiraceae bacterium]